MSKAPAFQFYPADFLVGTAFFTNTQRGAYITMLCHQWDKGKLAEGEAMVLCADLTESQRMQVWDKFVHQNGHLFNARLERERAKQQEFRERQSKNSRKRWKTKKKSSDGLGMAWDKPGSGLGEGWECSSIFSLQSSSSSSSSSSKEELHCEAPEKPEPSRDVALRILDFLNQKTGRSFRAYEGTNGKRKPTASMELVLSRLKAGATEEDMKGVIARKVRQWGGDAKMEKFLRPATLFSRTNYDQYVGEQEGGVERC